MAPGHLETLGFIDGRVAGEAGVATPLATTETLVREVTIRADGQDVVVGASTVVFSGSTRRGLLVVADTDRTIVADSADLMGLRSPSGRSAIDLRDVYFDVATNDHDVYFLAIKT